MLGILPIFAGLLACMPEWVPLGDPEKSRVDPEMNGYWFIPGDESFFGGVLVIEPWDKRTWLMLFVTLQEKDEVDIGDAEVWTYDGFVDYVSAAEFDEKDYEFGAVPYKAWLVRLKGALFFTWELRGIRDSEDDGMEPSAWIDLRIVEKQPDRLVLDMIDPDFEPLKEAPATRRGWERVVRRHIDEEELYFGELLELIRVRPEDRELFVELANHAMTQGE